MMHPALTSVRTEASNRRSALREAFMRHDPQHTGKVAPHRVREVIAAQRIDINEESVAKFMHYGRFEWMSFCDALERELASYLNKEGSKIAASPRSTSPRHNAPPPQMMRHQMGGGGMSPRRLPALLRTAEPRSPRAPGFMNNTLSPRAPVGPASPRGSFSGGSTPIQMMSPRATLRPTAAMRAARLARIQSLNNDVMEAMSLAGERPVEEATTRPHLIARVAKSIPIPAAPEEPQPAQTRLHAAMERLEQERLPSPRLSGPNAKGLGNTGRASPRRSGAMSPRDSDTMSVASGVGPVQSAQQEQRRKPKPQSRLVLQMQDKLAQQFSDIKKAFKYVDLDGNGRVTQKEIERALHMWNIPIDPEQIAELMASCDQDEDGGVDYDEFVDALARDTVAPDAMGKRGMLSKDAMGVDAYEMLNEQLGHKKIKNHAMPDWMKAGGGSDASKAEMTREEAKALAQSEGGKQDLRAVKDAAINAVNSRFGNMRKAFQYLDLDGNGKVGPNEVERAMHMWGIPYDKTKLSLLMAELDADGDGNVSYNEFIDHLARDTVAPDAMGKRGMLSKDAMGVDAYEMLNEQLGHKKIKNYKMASFNEEPEKEKTSRIKPGMSRDEQLKLFDKKELDTMKGAATDAVASRFSNIRKAFQAVDVDNSGKIGRNEVKRALHLWGVPHDEEKLDMLMIQLDEDGDGQVSYDEFVDHLARDTVAPAAMGKRGMLSKDAMGVDAYEMLNEQLGHKKIKNYKMPTM